MSLLGDLWKRVISLCYTDLRKRVISLCYQRLNECSGNELSYARPTTTSLGCLGLDIMGEGGEGGVPGSFPIVFVYAASCEGHVSDPSLAS